MKAIILGTGNDAIKLEGVEKKEILTEFGNVDYYILNDIIFLPRHGINHSLSPDKINYKANIMALKMLKVEDVIALYAVGSMTNKVVPGYSAIIKDFIDFSSRNLTFFDGVQRDLKHIDMINLFDKNLASKFYIVSKKNDVNIIDNYAVYVTTAGPRLETPSEIKAYRILGADIVGMTMASEAILIREIGLNYLPIATSINWAAGLDEEGVSFLEKESIHKISKRILKCAIDTLS